MPLPPPGDTIPQTPLLPWPSPASSVPAHSEKRPLLETVDRDMEDEEEERGALLLIHGDEETTLSPTAIHGAYHTHVASFCCIKVLNWE